MKKKIGEKSGVKFSSPEGSSENSLEKARREEKEKQNEELEEAKKASRGKAANFNKAQMYKKSILEDVLNYGVIIVFFAILVIGFMEFSPIIFEFFGGLIRNIVMGAFEK